MSTQSKTNTLKLFNYTLPDRDLFYDDLNEAVFKSMVWRVDQTIIIIGRGNTPEESVLTDIVLDSGLMIMKRPTGGEAVVLSSKMALISIAERETVVKRRPSKHYFHTYNMIITTVLKSLGVNGIEEKGISDLAIGGRKILGSSMHRNKTRIFYHAVLNLAESPHLIDALLKPPLRIPDYRNGRPHKLFVTSLQKEGYLIDFDKFRKTFNTIASEYLDKKCKLMT